ncbi:MAG: hypothetical protein ABSA11_17270 [Candidatus Bathyarchaeia archaeon]|jgi:hypothetical protein
MVDLGEVQTAYYMVAATGVLVAAIYYIMNMRASRRSQELAQKTQEQNLVTRQAQLFMQLYQTSMSKDFMDSNYRMARLELKTIEDYKKMMNDPIRYRDFHTYGMWLEGAGVLVKEGLIDIRTVSLLSSGLIVWWWDYYGDMILKVRNEFGFPRFMIEAEYLAKMVNEYGLSHPELKIASDKAFSEATGKM